MGLRSESLLAGLAVTTVLLLAALLRWWPALGAPGGRRALGRARLLAALQVSLLSLIFVSVNRSQEFYASWSDLLGTTTIAGQVRPATSGTGARRAVRAEAAAAPSQRPRARRSASGAPPPLVAGRPGGELRAVHFSGPVSGLSARGYVFLPPAYSRTGPRLPVTVVISRDAARATAVYGAHRVAAAAAAGMATGQVPRMIVVVLSPAVAGPADLGCLDIPGGPQAGQFFTQDLPRAVRGAFRASLRATQWAVLGGPGGGYCALQLATAPAGVFAVAAVPSAVPASPPGRPVLRTSWLASEYNLQWRLRHWPPPPLRLLFTGPGRAPALRALVRPPAQAAVTGLAPGRQPLVPVLASIGRELAAR